MDLPCITRHLVEPSLKSPRKLGPFLALALPPLCSLLGVDADTQTSLILPSLACFTVLYMVDPLLACYYLGRNI